MSAPQPSKGDELDELLQLRTASDDTSKTLLTVNWSTSYHSMK